MNPCFAVPTQILWPLFGALIGYVLGLLFISLRDWRKNREYRKWEREAIRRIDEMAAPYRKEKPQP